METIKKNLIQPKHNPTTNNNKLTQAKTLGREVPYTNRAPSSELSIYIKINYI